MKQLTTLAFLIFSISSFSQDCSNYFYMQDKKTIEMTISNNKGKESGKMIYKISNTTKNGNSITSTVNSEFVDTKGNSTANTANNVKCTNGVMQMDMKVFIPASQQGQIKAGTASATDVYLEYPSAMKSGDQLKDGLLVMDYETMSGLKTTLEISITERKVEGNESITTPAGTWECFKITSKNRILTKVMSVGIPINMTVTEWFAPGFGIVKTESRSGKTEITSIK